MKFLKQGSWTDLLRTIRPGNLVPLVAVGLHNLDLVKYLVSEVTATETRRLRTLRAFMPTAHPRDWELITAGQRVQVMKKDDATGGVLQFGTEIITGADGTIAGLLGASPGASTAAPNMLDVLARCFPQQFRAWEPRIRAMIPSFGTSLNANPDAARASLAATADTLGLVPPTAALATTPAG
jgi:malate dehydrogenase (quinone)